MQQFADSDKSQAFAERLRMEILNNGSAENTEIVLLNAPTEAHIRNTHARYFENGLEDALARLQA